MDKTCIATIILASLLAIKCFQKPVVLIISTDASIAIHSSPLNIAWNQQATKEIKVLDRVKRAV